MKIGDGFIFAFSQDFWKVCTPLLKKNVVCLVCHWMFFQTYFFQFMSVIYHINNIYIARISCHLHLGLYIYYFTFQYNRYVDQYWQYCRSDACFTDFNMFSETDIYIHVCGTYRGQILRQISTLRQWRCGYCSWQLWCRPLTLYNISLKKRRNQNSV